MLNLQEGWRNESHDALANVHINWSFLLILCQK